MRREQLEHLIRACAEIADVEDIVVVGSQAILAQYPQAPASMLISVEADVYPLRHQERAAVIDGAIGEGSPFHETFEYYAHGVGEETVIAPRGWTDRLVPLSNANTRGATGWCMDTHDLVLAKCVAGREKDWRFAEDALRHGLVDPGELRARVRLLPLTGEPLAAVTRGLEPRLAKLSR